MKSKIIFTGIALVVTCAVATSKLMSNGDSGSGLLFENLEAMAFEENGDTIYPDYVNESTTSSDSEFKTEISSDGVKVEWKRTCTTHINDCKSKNNKWCFKSLIKSETTCGQWSVSK